MSTKSTVEDPADEPVMIGSTAADPGGVRQPVSFNAEWNAAIEAAAAIADDVAAQVRGYNNTVENVANDIGARVRALKKA